MKINEILEKFTDHEFEELKAEVAEDTDANCHTEALISIASYYEMPQLDYFLQVKELQDDPMYQGLTIEQAHERLDMTHKMFDELEKMIGIDKARELYSCL